MAKTVPENNASDFDRNNCHTKIMSINTVNDPSIADGDLDAITDGPQTAVVGTNK
jgi:hypothetical protein